MFPFKDFRPISLSSFILKTLDRPVDLHIKTLLQQPVSIFKFLLIHLLEELEKLDCRVIAYASDVALMVKGALYDLTQRYLNMVINQAVRSGLAVHPSKTELVFFTRKYKIPDAGHPFVGDQRLQLSNKGKYLGLILDGKLSQRPNIEERTRKVSAALYCCGGALERYGVVKSIMETQSGGTHLRRLPHIAKQLKREQRAALIGISEALPPTPKLELNVMQNIAPVDIADKTVAARTAI